MKKILTIIFIFFIVSCSREPLTGTAYVIKGDGSVVRAAATTVYILPFANIEEFINALELDSKATDRINLDEYLVTECAQYQVNKLKQRDLVANFSPSCSEEKINEQKFPLQIQKNNLSNEIARFKALKLEKERELISTNNSLINTTVECSQDYPVVTLTNNTPYRIQSVGSLYTYIGDTDFSDCRKHSADLAPGSSMTVNTGKCSSSWYEHIEKTKYVIDNKIAEVCTITSFVHDDDYIYPVYERMGPSGDWKVTDAISGEDIDFKSMANEIIGEGNLMSLQSNLKYATEANEKLLSCEKINSNISGIKDLTCPISGSNRTEIFNFINQSSSFGIALDSPPISFNQSISTFAKKTAIHSTNTDVDGNFFLDGAPNKTFLIFTEYSDSFNELKWLIPITTDINKIELNNSNSYDIDS
ncbi:hypothetical protein OAT83_00440 [Gammaproteobacteria bacterium]|nr:hypothetical protein [Gammaproteobacteria bacterium]